RIMKRQFEALRDGDRYWYERVLSGSDRERVERTQLSDIIRRNTAAGDEIQDDVFHVGAGTSLIFSDGFESGGMDFWDNVVVGP
ncbi:MAG: peroxidase family protein, partial [Acidobacteriota bacterium]